MKTVNIAEFKAHLGKHLRAVRQGKSLVVADRGVPVATVAPYEEPSARSARRLRVQPATQPAAEFFVPRPPPFPGAPSVDLASLLREERREQDERLLVPDEKP